MTALNGIRFTNISVFDTTSLFVCEVPEVAGLTKCILPLNIEIIKLVQ